MTENYQVLPEYKRFNQRDNAIMRVHWDEPLTSFHERERRSIQKNMENAVPGFTLLDRAFDFAASTMTSVFGTSINRPNSGLTSWSALDAKYDRAIPPGVVEFDASNPVATRLAMEKAARFFGADLVGFAPLDERWVYSHHFRPGQEEENPPVDIPKGCDQVIVMGLSMDYEMFRTAPTAVMAAETHRNYSQMAVMVASMAQFIRSLGYRAIPCLNDTALNVPLAIDAGLAQPSRIGLAITPEFGPRVRFCKVITDLPLQAVKHHVDFGAIAFCETCGRCVEACPVKAVPAGPRTTSGPDRSSNNGVLKWYLNAERCRHHFAHVATNCGICLRVCPFNHGKGFHHTVAKWLVRLRLRWVNRLLVLLHTWIGYDKQEDPASFWSGRGS